MNVEDIVTSELTLTYYEKVWKLVLDHKARDVQLGAIPVGKVDRCAKALINGPWVLNFL